MHIHWKKEIFTIPNLLSLFRLVLIPVYLSLYLNAEVPSDYWRAGFVLALSCLTDAVDGKIARKFHMISNLGKLLDPLADKCTQLSLTICLSTHYPVLLPVLCLFIVKEFFQLVAVILNFRKGKVLPGALFAGKVCTTVLFLSLIFLVLFPNQNEKVVAIISLIDFGFLTFSFVRYILAYYGKNKLVEDFHSDE